MAGIPDAARETLASLGAAVGSLRRGEVAEGGAKILIVDDAPMTLNLLRTYLEDAGYQHIVTTDRSTEAMSLMLAEDPDIVLLDLKMPEVSGFEVLAQVRAHPDVLRVPILILTASEDAADRMRALELGATDFLAKPVDISELALRMRNTITAMAFQDRLAHYDAMTLAPYEPPTPDEFRALLSRWELTGGTAGEFVGVKGRQIRRYVSGQTPVPYAVLFTLAVKREGVQVSADRWREELRIAG